MQMGPLDVARSRLVRELKEIFKTLTDRNRALNEKCIMLEKQIGIFIADRTELQNQLSYGRSLVEKHEACLHDEIEEQNKFQEQMSQLEQQVTELLLENCAATLLLDADKVYTSSLLQVTDQQRKEIDHLKSLILSQDVYILNLEQQVNSQVEGQIDNEAESQFNDQVEGQFEGEIGANVVGQVDATASALGVTEATTTAEESAAVTALAEDAGLVEEIDCRDTKTESNRRRRMRYKMSLKKKESAQEEEEEDMSADSGTVITEEAESTSTIPSKGADAISADALNITIAVDSLRCTDKEGTCKE